jgi:class 3 adenylate cyclase
MQEHRHATIMFSDIVGYTSLRGSDENLAFKLLRNNREIHKRLIKKFQGILIKEMGDGMLASFQLASYAVRCAQAIQFEAEKNKIPLDRNT